jgi:uncharacterized membrane protein
MSPIAPEAAGETPSPADPFARRDPPLFAATLWPHRSLSRRGFGWVMLALGVGLAIPLLSVWGTPVAWALSPFLIGALALVYAMIEASYRSGRLREQVRVWPDLMAVERREPAGRVRRWSANPYWVTLELRDTRSAERYLTLRGGGRTIELGAFLTPDERGALADELRAVLSGIVTGAPDPAPQ